jgi:mannose-1-phosphate guanylyltransferase/mannose-6-phosphate isomerase
LSRRHYPKQFLKLRDTSLFQDTFLRSLLISEPDEIFVVTNESHKFLVRGQVQELGYELPASSLLIEPEGKNTLPAICYGMKVIEQTYGKSTVGIFPADHMLDSDAMEVIRQSEVLAGDFLVTFGIVPTSPNTGYGYIDPGEPAGMGFVVREFREKPEPEAAQNYVDSGFLWNSGMFVFDTGLFFEELNRFEPEIWQNFSAMDVGSMDSVRDIYSSLSSLSVDYGIMEKSSKVAVVKLDYDWNDLGNFNAICETFGKDAEENVVLETEGLLIDSSGNLVSSRSDKLVCMIDMEDTVVVDTSDALLVCPRASSGKVRDVVRQLNDKQDERARFHQTVYRPWGTYTVMDSSPTFKIKNITVLPGNSLSLQLHHHRSEHWVVVTGMACVQVDKERFYLRQGESTFIKAGIKHRLSNPGKLPLEIIEVQLGESVDEDDIVRFDDEYGRK